MLAAIRQRGHNPQLQHLDPNAGIAIGYVYEPSFLAPGQEPLPAWRAEDPVIGLVGSLYANGEVSEGSAASSSGSVAAICSLYERDPESFPAGLDGYFSLALWDAERHRVTLTNDRLGNRTFYYHADPARSLLIFASELKPILEHPVVRREVDRQGLAAYLSRGYVPAPLTIFKGISKATPGQAVVFQADAGLSVQTHWRAERLVKQPGDLEYWSRLSRERIGQAITKVSRSTPRIGVQLSGGVDSSIVAAVLAEAGRSEVECLTIAWPDTERSEDAIWSAKVAAHLGLRHTILEAGPDRTTPELVARLLGQFDEPVDSAARAIGLHVMSEAAYDAGLTSIIDGSDSEQLFSAADDEPTATDGENANQNRGENWEENLLSGRYFSHTVIERILSEPPSDLAGLLKRFVHDFDELLPADDPVERVNMSYFLRTPTSRYGAFSQIIPPLSGVESRRGFRDYDLFEFSRTIRNDIKGSLERGTSRQLLKAAFGGQVQAILERTDLKGAPGNVLLSPRVTEVFLNLAKHAAGTGLFQAEEINKVVNRLIKKQSASARARFRTLAIFLVWHAFYIERRDPFETARDAIGEAE